MDRRQFMGAASGLGVAISLPAKLAASELHADITDLTASQLSAAIREQ